MSVNIFGRRKGLFKLTPQGDFDIKMKRICHVKAGVDPDDAATLAVLNLKIEQLKKDILAKVRNNG